MPRGSKPRGDRGDILRKGRAQALAGVGAGLAITIARGDTLHVPADYPTIQAAIAAAADGDEIIVFNWA
jgi:hypothetical protein